MFKMNEGSSFNLTQLSDRAAFFPSKVTLHIGGALCFEVVTWEEILPLTLQIMNCELKLGSQALLKKKALKICGVGIKIF